MQRQAILDSYAQQPQVSVLIVGAGINGIGVFRDLALQGVDVLLVDKADFCSGASAASSRLVHGGLRYLEHGSFRLVREALTERNRLIRNAPHAVKPLPFTIPIFSRFSGLLNAPLKFLGLLEKPDERGWVAIKLGMLLYDWFTRQDRITPPHRMLSRREVLQHYPALNPEVIGAATYYDSVMPYAERIGVELVLDAEADGERAHALNYVSLVGAEGDAVSLQDHLSGRVFAVKPQVVVNAAGAWIDFVNRAMKRDTQFIGGTKGSHIVIDHPPLLKLLGRSALYFENRDGRMCILLPLIDKVIVGATDIRIDDPDQAVCSDDEIDYFFDFLAYLFPGMTADRSQVVFHFSGVRPLPYVDVAFTGLVPREHSVAVLEPDEAHPFPVYSLVGGKWTTFRAFAEEVTDRVLGDRQQPRRAQTRDLPIGGGRDYPDDEAQQERWLQRVQAASGLAMPRLKTLFGRYGTHAEVIARYLAEGEDRPLGKTLDYSEREIRYIVEHEKAVHLDDVLLRRSLLAMRGLVDHDLLRQVGGIMGDVYGWSGEQIDQEIERATRILIDRHGVPAHRLRSGEQERPQGG